MRLQSRPPALHGPYIQRTRTVNGKTVTRFLTEEQLARYQPWSDNARRLKDLRAKSKPPHCSPSPRPRTRPSGQRHRITGHDQAPTLPPLTHTRKLLPAGALETLGPPLRGAAPNRNWARHAQRAARVVLVEHGECCEACPRPLPPRNCSGHAASGSQGRRSTSILSVEEVDAVFGCGREVGTDCAELPGAGEGSKAAGHLLPDFDHSDFSLGRIEPPRD